MEAVADPLLEAAKYDIDEVFGWHHRLNGHEFR